MREEKHEPERKKERCAPCREPGTSPGRHARLQRPFVSQATLLHLATTKVFCGKGWGGAAARGSPRGLQMLDEG